MIKKLTALALALIMIMGVAAIGVSAQTAYNYTISTEFYGYDAVSSDWKPLETAAVGDAVKMRVSISTNFNSGPSTILLAYDKSVLVPTGLSTDSSTDLVRNPDFALASKKIRKIICADGAFAANHQVGLGNITSEQFAKYGFLAVSIQTLGCIVYDGSDWIFEVDMAVLGGSKGKSLECFVIPETVCTIENTEGYVSFPFAEDGATDLNELTNAYLWYESTPTLKSKKAEVTVDNTVPETYEVTFIVDGNVYDTAYFASGAALTYPEAPEKEGYEFKGWADSSGHTYVAMPSNDIELFAQFEAEKFTYVFDATQGGMFENGERTMSFVYEYGETPADFDEIPEYPGMEFVGWDNDIPSIVTEDMIFTAEYQDVEYTVTFVDSLGNIIDEIIYCYGDEVYDGDIPEGYKAENSWYIGNKGNIVSFPYTVTEDVVMYALSDANVYNATFDAGEGVFADGTSVKVVPTVYGEQIAVPQDPVREGYNFVMWDPEPGVMDIEDVYFEAIYKVAPIPDPDPEPEEVTVTFVDCNGDVIDELYYYSGDVVYDIDVPEGYKSENSWYIGNKDNIVSFPYTVTEDVVMYALSDANVYNATFDAGEGVFADGTSVKVVPTVYGEQIAMPEDPVREGYNFVMWDPEPGVMDIEDVYFEAIYKAAPIPEPEDVTVTFVDCNGDVIDVVTAPAGTDLTAPELPSEEGYTYSWDKEVPAKMPEKDMTITAVRTANKYNAVFDANGGAFANGGSAKSVSVAYGAEIIVPESPVKDGYQFAGWSIDGVNVVSDLGVMDSVKGKEFVALWINTSKATYTVETYTMNTAGTYQVSSADYQGKVGETVTASYTVPYGFSLNSAKSVISGVVAADGSLVLKVYIDRNRYAFTTVVDGVRNTEYYIYGAAINMPATPSKAGYVFAGWDKSFPSIMPAEDITVTAVFNTATTLKIKNNPVSRTIKYGETLRLTAEVTDLPEGASVQWIVEGSGFSVSTSEDGMTCELKSTGKGTVTITAKVVDANGNVLADASGNEVADSEQVTSKAGIWQKIVSFFKNLFRMNRTIVQVFKIW